MNPSQDLSAALEELAKLSKARQKPGHRHARAILVPLGQLLLEGSTTGIDGTLAHIAEQVAPLGKAWDAAVEAELRMACEEHCQSVDPRYLDLANYDFGYTVTARERLEARLMALEALGVEVPAELRARIERSDELLEPYLRDRDVQ